MSEKLYRFLLRLYPEHFRRAYGGEMLRLVADRARCERGFVSGLRLWLDLLWDLATSLARECSNKPISAGQALDGGPSLRLIGEWRPNRTLLCLGGTLSALMFWVCGFVVEHRSATRFPALLPVPLLQRLAQSDSSGQSVSDRVYSFCMTATRDIPSDSVQPLFSFHFGRSGASGTALIDGKVVKIFHSEQRLSIRAHVSAGDHQFILHLIRPAENTLISSNDYFKYCQAK
jgi:hypothetical protein